MNAQEKTLIRTAIITEDDVAWQILGYCQQEATYLYTRSDNEKPRRARWLKEKGYKCSNIITQTKGFRKGIPQRLLCEKHSKPPHFNTLDYFRPLTD